MLESLARVLQLDDAGIAYLFSLGAEKLRRTRRRPRKETVRSGIGELLGSLTLPAFVEGRYFDVLAANPLATTLSPRLTTARNRLRDVFLDPAERSLYPDWEDATMGLVAGFRESDLSLLASYQAGFRTSESLASTDRATATPD